MGYCFFILAFIPGIKKQADKADLIVKVSLKFRTVGSVALVLLLITGIFQLQYPGVRWNLDYFTSSHWGKITGLKILVFLAIVFISVIQDYCLGNLAIEAWKNRTEDPKTHKIKYLSRLLDRVTCMLALTAVFLGVILVRGW